LNPKRLEEAEEMGTRMGEGIRVKLLDLISVCLLHFIPHSLEQAGKKGGGRGLPEKLF